MGGEEKAREQGEGKEVIVEEADVEWEVEKESTSNTFVEHEDVQSDDVACLDTDVLAQEGGSGFLFILIIECYENHSHLQPNHWIYLRPLKQQRGDNDGKGVSQECIDHVQSDGQQSMPAQEK